MKGLYAEMQAHYKSTKARSRMQGKLIIERIRTDGGWPKLKAKAAATRHWSSFAVCLAQKCFDGTDHGRRMLAVAQLLDRFYQILNAEGRFFGGCQNGIERAREKSVRIIRAVVYRSSA